MDILKKQTSPGLTTQGSEEKRLPTTDSNISDIGNIVNNDLGKWRQVVSGAGGREEQSAGKGLLPPYSNTGVENVITKHELDFGIDYLSLTIYGDRLKAMEIYLEYFIEYLGDLNLEGETRFYQERYINGGGFEMLCISKNKASKPHSVFRFPGTICEKIPLEAFRKLQETISRDLGHIACSRIDIKLDGANFKPLQVADDIASGKAITRAQRETLKKYELPFEVNDLGEVGTQGLTLGSRESDRYLRIYDKHGFTRIELECKGDAAQAYFWLIFPNLESFTEISMGIILDFIDLDTDYWRDMIGMNKRLGARVTDYQEKSYDKLEKYLEIECIQAFGIMAKIKGEVWVQDFAKRGLAKARANAKYNLLLHAYGIDY